ncbi:hypothetical protein [Streptomyces sp. NPDC086766]|uniref:hypothetical protein n=1 Tax=Streptomyces sp. NPDC086766 TaxID=3365754 RepID=UPI00381FB85B
MLVMEALVALLCLGAGTLLVRRGLRSWRTEAPAGDRSAILIPGMKDGTERALLPLGVFSYFLGSLLGTVVCLHATHHMGGANRHLSLAPAIVLLVLLVGTTASALTVVAITTVGRPRCLVPPQLRRRQGAADPAGFAEDVPVGDDDDDGSARGGYLISVVPGALTTTLAERIGSMRADSLSVAVSHRELLPGGNYLLGGPGEPTCEVVQIAEGEPMPPGGPLRVRRGRFRTIASTHPAGTPVTPVTAEYVEDWARWVPGDAPPA